MNEKRTFYPENTYYARRNLLIKTLSKINRFLHNADVLNLTKYTTTVFEMTEN